MAGVSLVEDHREMSELSVPPRFAAVSIGLSGVAWGVATVPHPNIFRDPVGEAVVATSTWQTIHLVAAAGTIAAIFGCAGIVAVQRQQLGPRGQVVLVGIVVGAVLTASILVAEALVLPVLAAQAPDLVELDGPIAGTVVMRALAGLGGLYPVGVVVLGVLSARCDFAPGAGRWLAGGTVLFWAFGLQSPAIGMAVSIVFAAVHLQWTAVLWRAGRTRQDVSLPSRSDQSSGLSSTT